MQAERRVEWPTIWMLLLCYGCWALAVYWLAQLSLTGAVLLTGVAIALHSSLQHEVLHGHPTGSSWLNMALVFPNLGLLVPYLRFRDDHLAHHRDENLTDPYDDPETNYLDPEVWSGLSRPAQVVLRLNNSLLGRMVIGPVLGQVLWMRCDLRRIRQGERAVLHGWLWHIPAVLCMLWLLSFSPMPWWGYGLSIWLGFGLLKIRTFLEHKAHQVSRARSVIIEDRGPLALLFLNNNFHAVHHSQPKVAWYELPALYQSRRDYYLRRNEGYRYGSYGQIFRRYLLAPKDPVAHPLYEPRR